MAIPADRLVVETDAPYLVPAPEKNRIRRNEPAFVKSVLLKLAAILSTDVEGYSRLIRLLFEDRNRSADGFRLKFFCI